MQSSWLEDTGTLTRRWFEIGRALSEPATLSAETPEMRSGYLPPPPDFASHSPFGGATWFQPPAVGRTHE